MELNLSDNWELFENETINIVPRHKLMQGGNVPGGHNCIYDGKRKPFITPMAECNSIALRHSDIVVDIGAYVGTYSIRCARFPVKKVIAYEPTPKSFNLMQLTPLPNLVNVNAAIVGDDTRSVDLYISKGIGVTNSLVPSKAKPTKVTIPAVNYAEAIKEASIVKIDIEGGEYDIPVEDLIGPNLRAILIDFHPVGKDWIEKSERIIEEILAQGFRTVIKPAWDNGWTRAGSWIRDGDTYGSYEPMMQGRECCGCGCEINGTKKSICTVCELTWSKKHKIGYEIKEKI